MIRPAQQNRRVMVLERHSQPELSDELALRVSALNDRSRSVLKDCGARPLVQEHRSGPYQSMQVWDKDSPAHIEFSAKEINAEDSGAIVENNVVEHFCGNVPSRQVLRFYRRSSGQWFTLAMILTSRK